MRLSTGHLFAVVVFAATVSVSAGITEAARTPKQAGACSSDPGFLAAHHRGPEAPGESNHFIDLWAGQPTRSVARLNGLTNNRTLFINSHGAGVPTASGARYFFYPHDALLRKGQRPPQYSAADFARILGPDEAAKIHNIVTAGCDREGFFSAAELRKHFVHATNIVHVAAGQPGFQSMFFQAIVNHSNENKTIYESAVPTGTCLRRYQIRNAPSPGARRLTPLIAELFRPGEIKPYLVQTAGRELLEPLRKTLTQPLAHCFHCQ